MSSCIKLAALSALLLPALIAAKPPHASFFGYKGVNASYDYVIIGGGTAGLALAYRLAEDGANSVAVVEAGGFYETDGGNTSSVPALNQFYDDITPDSQYDFPLTDWGFLTTAQQGAAEARFHYGRGKMLGGWY